MGKSVRRPGLAAAAIILAWAPVACTSGRPAIDLQTIVPVSPDNQAGFRHYWTIERGIWDNRGLLQVYSASQVAIDSSGALSLKAAPAVSDSAQRPFMSARIDTAGKFLIEPGSYLEIDAQIPSAKGLWPAIWLRGPGDWPQGGEIDIAEVLGTDGTVRRALHSSAKISSEKVFNWDWSRADALTTLDLSRSHYYGVIFDDEQVRFFVDRKLVQTVERKPYERAGGAWTFDQPHYLIINMAISSENGDASHNTWPQSLTIRHVNIYARPDFVPGLDPRGR